MSVLVTEEFRLIRKTLRGLAILVHLLGILCFLCACRSYHLCVQASFVALPVGR